MHRIDANIILRYVLDDHEELSPRAADLIEKSTVAVSTEILCEVVYVLAGVYKVPRIEIRDTLKDLASHPSIEVLEEKVICHAAKTYADKNIDFVDALLLAHHQLHEDKVETFDKKLQAFLQAH